VHADAANIKFFECGQDFEGERVFNPVLGDDWRDFCFHEGPYLFYDPQLFSRQRFDEFIEVTIGRR